MGVAAFRHASEILARAGSHDSLQTQSSMGGSVPEMEPRRGVSVVVPIYNEEENVRELVRELKGVLDPFKAEESRKIPTWSYEIVLVDDGSRDGTARILAELCEEDPHLVVVQFRRNFGQTAAMAAGFDAASFETVVTMDGDLQNDPREIPKLVKMLGEGYDLVAGWRKHRHDAFFSRKLPSRIANWIISRSTRVQLHDYGCTLKAMTYEVAKGIKLYGEMHRFIPALADEIGARIAEVPVNHRARRFGKSKYGISRTIRVVLDLITVKFLLGYSKRPIHLFGSAGLISSIAGFLLLSLLTYQRAFMDMPMGNRPLLSLGVMLVIIGLQFLVFGLLGEVLARTYYESQGKPIYVIRRIMRSKESDAAEQNDRSTR